MKKSDVAVCATFTIILAILFVRPAPPQFNARDKPVVLRTLKAAPARKIERAVVQPIQPEKKMSSPETSYNTAASSDSSYGDTAWTSFGTGAIFSLDNGETSYYCVLKDFEFAIPEGATITGIVGILTESITGNVITTDRIRIVKGGVIGSTELSAGPGWESGYDAFGGEDNLCGETWTRDDINDPDFGVAIACTSENNGGEGLLSGAQLWIYYTLPIPNVAAFVSSDTSGPISADAIYSFDFTTTDVANRFLAVSVHLFGNATVSSITYNGDPLELIGARSDGGNTMRTEMWGMVAPDVGTYALLVNLSDAVDSVTNAVLYEGVAQDVPVEGFVSDVATNPGPAEAAAELTISQTSPDCLPVVAITTDDTSIVSNQTARNNVSTANGSAAQADLDAVVDDGQLMSFT